MQVSSASLRRLSPGPARRPARVHGWRRRQSRPFTGTGQLKLNYNLKLETCETSLRAVTKNYRFGALDLARVAGPGRRLPEGAPDSKFELERLGINSAPARAAAGSE